MAYFSKVYKNGLINIPKPLRGKIGVNYVSLEERGGSIVVTPINEKPKRSFEDKIGVIREYENGDFDVEFKEGLTKEAFQKAVSNLKK